MLQTIPIVPLAGNLTVGIAVLSYDGDLTVGLYADRDRGPDLDVLTKGIEAGFGDYLDARG